MESFFSLKMLSNTGIQKMADIGLLPFFLILLVSLISSLFISHLYLRFYGSRGSGSTLHRAFPLLGVAITAIFVSLQFSVPLSLGLLGALSIVRFRTPIKDPEEVGFILLVIASSLTCATFNLPFLILIFFVSILGLFILKVDKKFFRRTANTGMIIINIQSVLYKDHHHQVMSTLESHVGNLSIDSVVEDEIQTTLSYTFGTLEHKNLMELKKQFQTISDSIRVNVFFNQQ